MVTVRFYPCGVDAAVPVSIVPGACGMRVPRVNSCPSWTVWGGSRAGCREYPSTTICWRIIVLRGLGSSS